MEEKERLLNTIKEINEDDKILTDWIVESNAKMKLNSQLNYAEEQGIEKGKENKILEVVKNMLTEGADYNFISKVTGKTVYTIKQIEKGLLIPNI